MQHKLVNYEKKAPFMPELSCQAYRSGNLKKTEYWRGAQLAAMIQSPVAVSSFRHFTSSSCSGCRFPRDVPVCCFDLESVWPRQYTLEDAPASKNQCFPRAAKRSEKLRSRRAVTDSAHGISGSCSPDARGLVPGGESPRPCCSYLLQRLQERPACNGHSNWQC